MEVGDPEYPVYVTLSRALEPGTERAAHHRP